MYGLRYCTGLLPLGDGERIYYIALQHTLGRDRHLVYDSEHHISQQGRARHLVATCNARYFSISVPTCQAKTPTVKPPYLCNQAPSFKELPIEKKEKQEKKK